MIAKGTPATTRYALSSALAQSERGVQSFFTQ